MQNKSHVIAKQNVIKSVKKILKLLHILQMYFLLTFRFLPYKYINVMKINSHIMLTYVVL